MGHSALEWLWRERERYGTPAVTARVAAPSLLSPERGEMLARLLQCAAGPSHACVWVTAVAGPRRGR